MAKHIHRRWSLLGLVLGLFVLGLSGCHTTEKPWPYNSSLGPEGPACFPCARWGGYYPTCWDKWPENAPACPPCATPTVPPKPPKPGSPFTQEPTPAEKGPAPAAVNKPVVPPAPEKPAVPAAPAQPPVPSPSDKPPVPAKEPAPPIPGKTSLEDAEGVSGETTVYPSGTGTDDAPQPPMGDGEVSQRLPSGPAMRQAASPMLQLNRPLSERVVGAMR